MTTELWWPHEYRAGGLIIARRHARVSWKFITRRYRVNDRDVTPAEYHRLMAVYEDGGRKSMSLDQISTAMKVASADAQPKS